MTHLEHPSPQLLEELARLRARLAEQEASELKYRQTEQALEEQRQLATLWQEVSDEYHRLLVSEQRAHAQAEEALQKQTMFLSSFIHDLKNPLTVVGGSAEVLCHYLLHVPAPYAVQLTQTIELLEAAQTEMMTMIEDALDLAHLQADQSLPLAAQSIDLVDLTRHVVLEQQHMTTFHKIVVETAAAQLIVNGNATQLKRVLANLISNAVKYSPKGGEILVKMRREEGAHLRAIIEIQDQGVGLPATELQAIFKPFYRATNVVEQVEGTGIGLASALFLIEQHGGTISAYSEEGKGTTFTVSLPLLK